MSTISAAGRKPLWFLSVAVAVVLLVAVASLPGAPVTTVSPSGSTRYLKSLGTDGEVTLSKGGPNLGLFLSSNVVSAGSSVSVTIDEKNPTSSEIVVPSANDWAVLGLSLSPCGTVNAPVGIGILAGFYTSDNISTVSKDQLLTPYEPGTYSCPAILSGITGYSFMATGDTAGVLQNGESSPAITERMNVQVNASGYWTTSNEIIPPSTSTFNNFPPGYYTLVGGDEWGTLIILHFLVVEPLASNQPFPLRFTLSLNTTSLVSGEAIDIKVDIYNTLSQVVSVNGTSEWVWSGLKAGPCPFFAGIVILCGYYTQANMTTGTPLQEYLLGLVIPCPAYLASHYVFKPLSDEALFFGDTLLAMGDRLDTSGYYAAGQTYNYGLPNGEGEDDTFRTSRVHGSRWGRVGAAGTWPLRGGLGLRPRGPTVIAWYP